MRSADFLYNFLPRFNRRKDMEEGSPLRALFAILQTQYDAIEADIEALYGNWFAQSCEIWALPYIADLIGGTGFERLDRPGMDARRLVVNTLAYRRRKGLAATLEQVIEDCTGWPARVVEFTRQLAVTQTVRHLRLKEGQCVNLGNRASLSHPDDAFDHSAHTIAIRSNAGYAPGRVGITVWRLQSYPLYNVTAHPYDKERYSLHPLGCDMPLFRRRGRRRGVEERLAESDVPVRLTAAVTEKGRLETSLSVSLLDAGTTVFPLPLSPEEIVFTDLSAWKRPEWLNEQARVALDPERGRLLLLRAEDHHKTVLTNHCYGFAADLGGGPYRRPPPPMAHAPSPGWSMLVAASPKAPNTVSPQLGDALSAWANQAADGIIEIADSRTYVPSGESGNWSVDFVADHARTLILRGADGERPCLQGGITVTAGPVGATLVLDGLLIGGTIRLSGRIRLIISHCSVFPEELDPAISATAEAATGMRVSIAGAIICGPIRLPCHAAALEIADSIVDGGDLEAIVGPEPQESALVFVDHPGKGAGPPTEIMRSTLKGRVMVEKISATGTIFIDRLVTIDCRDGTVNHCWLPASSQTPYRLRCLTEIAAPISPKVSPQAGMRRAGEPIFASTNFGEAGYFRLAAGAPDEIRHGASDGGEIGVYHRLGERQREQSLQEALAEYLPYGLDPIVIFNS